MPKRIHPWSPKELALRSLLPFVAVGLLVSTVWVGPLGFSLGFLLWFLLYTRIT